MKRRRGMTLIELTACVLMLGAATLVFAQTLTLSFAWGRTTEQVLSGKLRATELSQALLDALRQGTPIEALSITSAGALREEAPPDAEASWSDDALILVRDGVYTVIAQEGAQVVRHELRWDGVVRKVVLVSGVASLTLEHVRQDGALCGVDYLLTFTQGGAPVAGFVGLRTNARSRGPLTQPTPAPIYGGAR